jgi:glutaminyl-tRNA synthetase
MHWVSAAHAIPAEIRLYDRLFNQERPSDTDAINPNSLEILTSCQVEPSLMAAKPGDRFQFERQGYFCMDPDSKPDALVFNRTVTLRDTWAKIEKTLKQS